MKHTKDSTKPAKTIKKPASSVVSNTTSAENLADKYSFNMFTEYWNRIPKKQRTTLGAFIILVILLPILMYANYQQSRLWPQAAKKVITPPQPPTAPKPGRSKDNPTIITKRLPSGSIAKEYTGEIKGMDRNEGEQLTMVVDQKTLPIGLFLGSCAQEYIKNRERITCLLQGVPEEYGTFTVHVTLYDENSGTTTREVNVKIRQ